MPKLPSAFHGRDFVEPQGSQKLSFKSTVLASFQAAHAYIRCFFEATRTLVNVMKCYNNHKQQPIFFFLPDITLNALETFSVYTVEHCLCPTMPFFMGDFIFRFDRVGLRSLTLARTL